MVALHAPPDLVARMAVPGPRYTSYPPANVWGEAGEIDYATALSSLGRAAAASGVSLYVHVPFCRVRCSYCGLNVDGARDPALHARYVDAVVAEAALVQARAGGSLRAVEMAFGGGTPTSLTAPALARLARGIAAAVPLAPGARLSVEVDPRVTTREQLDVLAAAGFRRVSVGVQDLDPDVQQAAGRVQSEEASRRTLDDARAAGFTGANVDLMYGLPRQEPAQLVRTVSRVLTWAPERVTLFGYAHLPSRFPNQRRMDAGALPGPAARLELLCAAAETLERAGYHWLGLDHFVREDDELWQALRAGRIARTFMGYVPTRPGAILGLGASSIGEVEGTFVQNTREARAYVTRIEAGRLATARGYRRHGEDELRAEVIDRLMCRLEADLDEVGARHGVDAATHFAAALRDLQPLVADGLVRVDGPRVAVTPLGRLFLRNVCMAFDTHLARAAAPTAHAGTV